jgi:hypothetical protein
MEKEKSRQVLYTSLDRREAAHNRPTSNFFPVCLPCRIDMGSPGRAGQACAGVAMQLMEVNVYLDFCLNI